MVLPTLDDLPTDRASCATCTNGGVGCPRSKSNKRFPNGYVLNSLTGEIGGIIACCPHYTGKFKKND